MSTWLYGASGHARVIIDTLQSQGREMAGIVDDDPSLTNLDGLPVAHRIPENARGPFIVSIGSNEARRKVVERLANVDKHFAKAVIHPSATVSPSATIGEGTVVMAGAVINAGAKIGRHCIINTGATVDHECRVADFVHISPGAHLCGNVSVGERSHVGVGVSIIPGISIGPETTIGAGAAVVNNIPAGVVAVGVPARIIKYKPGFNLENKKHNTLNNSILPPPTIVTHLGHQWVLLPNFYRYAA